MRYVHITAEVTPDDRVVIADRVHPVSGSRMVTLDIGPVALMLGHLADLDRIAVLDRIITGATELRRNAAARHSDTATVAAVRTCEAVVGHRAGEWGEEPVVCGQVVGLRTITGSDGLGHAYCSTSYHREQITRRFGLSAEAIA
jgi:hypothetical protein